MMEANFHTHTYRCHHADGTEREYIETAIAGGTKILGFSDHAPYPFADGYISPIRMKPSELEDYVRVLEDLRREYARDIDIRIGLEAEYYPQFFDAFLRMLEPYPIEYLLLGQHFLSNEMDGGWIASRETGEEGLLKAYVDQVSEAMRTGEFLYLAHPDLIHYVGDSKVYRREMRRLIRCAVETETPLEINLLGIKLGRNYPNPVFWELVGETDQPVVLGTDSHHTNMVLLTECEAVAREYVAKYGLNLREGDLMKQRR